MALLDSLRALIGRGTRYENITYVGPGVSEVLGMGPDELYRTQPHLRTVVTFLARNIAHLGLHTFELVGETDRRRTRTDPLAQLLAKPNETDMTTFQLMYRLIADFSLYDVAVWMIVRSAETASGWAVYPIPPSWVMATGGGTAWAPAWMEVIRPGSGTRVILEQDEFVLFGGYDPSDPGAWSSPVGALKQILAEQIEAWVYRQQVWRRGGRVGNYLTRPTGSQWSADARERFMRAWDAKWTGPNGPKAGGTPILEDGMELKTLRFNAREEEWSEVAKLSLSTVAAVYQVSPTMVGVLDNANFSNVREFRRMLYTETLGPLLAMIEAVLNTVLRPRVTSADVYAEFNIAEKLQGSFEEQAQVISSAVGRPWMTADEGRARFNMPALGGDAAQLVTPLNVLVGGQASPRDSGSQNRAAGPAKPVRARPAKATGPTLSRESSTAPLKVKADARSEDEAAAEQVLRRFYRRQKSAVLSALGAKADDEWWDGDRWDDELADDLYALAMSVTAELGPLTLSELGIEPDLYDVDRTAAFLRAVAESRASAINAATLQQLQAALAGDVGEDAQTSTPAGVFDQAVETRAAQGGQTLATTLAAFAVTEAARQMARPETTKTWSVRSGNPRSSHARMDGETVPIDGTFSNGMAWPGDPAGGVDEVAGCMCSVEVTIP